MLQVCENTEDKHGEKREVLSSSKVDIPSLLRGPPGPTGPAGSRVSYNSFTGTNRLVECKLPK